MAYTASLSQTPPALGASKPLWAPDLFDAATGAYPKAAPPSSASYPLAGGKVSYFEGTTAWGSIRITAENHHGHVTGLDPVIQVSYSVDPFDVPIYTDAARTIPVLDGSGAPIVLHSTTGQAEADLPAGSYYLGTPTITGVRTTVTTPLEGEPTTETLAVSYTVKAQTPADPLTITEGNQTAVNLDLE